MFMNLGYHRGFLLSEKIRRILANFSKKNKILSLTRVQTSDSFCKLLEKLGRKKRERYEKACLVISENRILKRLFFDDLGFQSHRLINQ